MVASDADLVRLQAKAELPLPGQAVRQADTPRWPRRPRRLAPDRAPRRWKRAGRSRLGDGADVEYVPEDVTVEREVATDWLVQSDGPFVAALDPT